MKTPTPAALAACQVLVVGDAMLDQYWFGDVERVSPEAPVPIVRVQRREERLGGAANVARNVASLGARTALLTATGKDEAGRSVMRLLQEAHIDPLVLADANLSTTVKLRVVGRQQQMVRIDFETAPEAEILAALLETYRSRVPQTGLVVLSDYGKGGLAHIEQMIALARAAGKPVLVDPKGDEYDRYKGATLLTPNRAELREVVGRWRSETDLAQRVQDLRRRLDLKAVLLTRSEEGMTLFTDDGAWSVPAQAREVFDVSGAGDTVIATFSMAASLRVPLFEGGRVQGRVRAAEARAQQERARLADLRARIYYEVQAVFLDLKATDERLEVAEGALALATEQVQQARDRFASGVADNLEVVQAQEALAGAEENRIASLYAINAARFSLARVLGGAETSYEELVKGR